MSYFHFPDNQCIFDVTPVENLFIEEYMRNAQGDFVKVYIYGLMHCYYSRLHVDIPSFAKALELDEATVGNAFKYWERRGLMRSDNTGIAFLNAKSIIYSDKSAEESLYKYKNYINNIQDIFEGRTLSPDELQTAIDWLEVYNFEPAAAIYMLVYCVEKKYFKVKKRISFAQLNKTAAEWADKDILTLDAAEAYVSQEERRRSGVKKVLESIGITRLPTDNEQALFTKWTTSWGFSIDAILAACGDLTRTNNPNLGLLDKILDDYRQKEMLTPDDIASHREHSESIRSSLNKVMYHIGSRAGITPALMDKYSQWLALGFTSEAILRACDFLASYGEASLSSLDIELARLKQEGLTTEAQISQKYVGYAGLKMQLEYIFQKAGISAAPSVSDLIWFESALANGRVTPDEILAAARTASDAKNKIAYIKRVLTQGSGQTSAQTQGLTKQVDFVKIPSHDYTYVEPDSLD